MRDPYIIAEIGSNIFKYHDNKKNLKNAYNQIESAKHHGASAVKFQMFSAYELWGPTCKGLVFADLQDRYALPPEWVEMFAVHCRKIGIDFLCSAFSESGFKYIDQFVKYHKVASPEVLSNPLRKWVVDNEKPGIFSMGCVPPVMLDEVLDSLRLKDIILECVSNYPADMAEYNIIPIANYCNKIKMRWGVSDHTKNSNLARFARANGASVFEKHVDFFAGQGDKTPDSDVSVNHHHFSDYVKIIKQQHCISKDDVKKNSFELYGRRLTKKGWFRPLPEGAPGVEDAK